MPAANGSTHHEIEAKLLPAPDVELSALDGVVAGARLEPLERLELNAAYYDTAALTLARAGTTVRHRTGDGPPTWTVKVPRRAEDGALDRLERSFQAPRNRRPREVAGIVAAHLRGRRLAVVAEVRTVRSRVALVDANGRALVEVAHDLVLASRGRDPLGSWEEIEVEVADHRDGPAAARTVHDALVGLGCRPLPPMPKLVRALGSPAREPADVTVPDLPSTPTVAAVVHQALARSVAQLLHHDPLVRAGDDAEDLHQLRVALRRLRSDLRTFEELLDAERAATLRAELGWAARETGERRDLDVLRAWLEAHADALPDDDRDGFAALLGRWDAQAQLARGRVLRMLASARYLDLVHQLVALVDEPPHPGRKADRRARHHLDRAVAHRWRQLERRIDRLGPEPDDLELHRIRIATKRARAAAEAVRPLHGRRARKLARALAAQQDVLGQAHDAAVFEAWLRTVDEPVAAVFAAGELAVEARLDRDRHVAAWPAAWHDAQRRHRALR